MPNSNNRHENERSIFSAKALYGERKVFLLLLYLNKYSISDDVCCASFPPTPVANAEVCTTTNCWHKFGNHDFKFFYSTY